MCCVTHVKEPSALLISINTRARIQCSQPLGHDTNITWLAICKMHIRDKSRKFTKLLSFLSLLKKGPGEWHIRGIHAGIHLLAQVIMSIPIRVWIKCATLKPKHWGSKISFRLRRKEVLNSGKWSPWPLLKRWGLHPKGEIVFELSKIKYE